MNYVTEKNNRVYVSGEIVSDATFSHEVYGEGFYEFFIRVMRLSGQADILPITLSERLIQGGMLCKGKSICALGQFRSYNKLENGRSRLMLTIFVRELLDELPDKNPNSILLSGYICKPPVYRTTPFNREIADVLIAVNRAYNKSDYLPCIAWGKLAKDINSNFKIANIKLAYAIASCTNKFNFCKVRFITQNINIALSKLAESSLLRTVSSKHIAYLKCFKWHR